MDGQQLEVSRAELLACVEHFKGMPVTQEVLIEYCNLNHIGVIGLGVYSDIVAQYNHDRRMDALVPRIMAVLAKYKSVPELLEQAQRVAVIDQNEELEVEICTLMEEEGVLYTEIELVTENLGSYLKAVLSGAGKRANNMAATMLAHTAKEKYGDPLVLKTLGEAYREIAKDRGRAAGL